MLQLLRYQVFLCYGALFLALWYASFQVKDNLVERMTIANIIIPWAPLWLLIVLGVYALGCIGYGMISSRDYPEAALELEQEIQEAKAEMKRRGIIQ
jgi:dolichyl-phosphate mannosyltransferase polypeptide 3